MSQVKFAFKVFGYGNVGDDLMLHGFCAHWPPDLPCYGIVNPPEASILNRRFPQIDWHTNTGQDEGKVWLGVGDTPIQMLSGDYFLRFLEDELLQSTKKRALRLMIGVGVESEAASHAGRFRKALEQLDFIWTRDSFSRDELEKTFGLSNRRLEVCGDMANAGLSLLPDYPRNKNRPVGLAFNFYLESMRWKTLPAIVRFLRQEAAKHKVVWLANETRSIPRHYTETRLYSRLEGFLNFRTRHDSIDLVMPNNYAISSGAMAEHFSAFETVVSCRYHCLLAAAWAGCRLVGIGRSSKITALCRDLDVPCIPIPSACTELEKAVAEARTVPRQKLMGFADSASHAIKQAAQLARSQVT